MKKPILLLVFLFCTLLTARSAPASPLSDYWDEKEVRAALDALPDLEKMERTLHFEVRDSDTGEILPEVSYEVHSWEDSDKEPINAAGQYDFVLPVGFPQNFTYTISAPGYGSKCFRLILDNNYAPDVSVKVELQRAKSVLGRVLNEDGAPISGVKVGVSGSSSGANPPGRMNFSGEAVSDAEGRWSVANYPQDFDEVNFSLAHPDYVTDLFRNTRKDQMIPAGEIILMMKRGIPFKGRVVDANDAPVPGAVLEVQRRKNIHTVSDAEGNFLFPNFDEHYDNWSLNVCAPGFADQYLKINPGMRQGDYKLVMAAGLPLRVQFLSPDGEPLADKKIWVSIATDFTNQVHFFDAETDAEGVLKVDDAPVGAKWTFSVSSGSKVAYQSLRDLSLDPGEEVHTLQLKTTASIAILVVDSKTDKPLDNFEVISGRLNPAREQHNYSGPWWDPSTWVSSLEFLEAPKETVSWEEFIRMPASRIFRSAYYEYQNHPIQFRIESPGYFPAETSRITGDDGEVLLKIRMTTGESLRVRAVDAQGAPCLDASATWSPKDQALTLFYGTLRSGEHYSYLSYVYADSSAWLQLPVTRRDAHILVVLSSKGIAFVNGSELREGQTITLSPWGQVEGNIAPEIAGMAEGIRIDGKISLLGMEIKIALDAAKDKDGHFSADRLLPGEYKISIRPDRSSSGINWAKATVRAGETATVGMSVGRAVKGQLEMPADAWEWFRKAPIKIYFIRTDIPSDRYSTFMTSKADGSFGISALPPGDYKIDDSYIVDPDGPNGGQTIRFEVETKNFTITDETEGTPLDLGILQVNDLGVQPERPIQKEDDGLLGTILKALQ